MRIVDILQRTPEWYAWRAQGVTASDAGALMGTDPDRTVWQLWAEKLGLVAPPDLSRNPLVRAGIENEPLARQKYEDAHGGLLLPVCGESDEHPALRASFDGMENDGSPVELKCPSEKVFDETKAQGAASEAYQRYYPQMQHQIYVASATKGVLAMYCRGDIFRFDVPRDDVFISSLIARALSFWDDVQKRVEPEKDPARDLFVPTGDVLQAWIKIAEEYRSIERERVDCETKVKRIEKRQGVLERELVKLMNGFARGAAAGVLLTRYVQQGSIDYKKVLEAVAPGVDVAVLESYRRALSERIRVTLTETVATPGTLGSNEREPLGGNHQEPSLYF